MTDPVELLRELVSISSVSRESNRDVIAFAQSILAKAGWSFEEFQYIDASGAEKVNLVAWPDAVAARQNAFHLALVCHTDTVPYAPEWAQATTLIEENDNLHGCGACDVKGFLACSLAVASQLETRRLKKPHGIILTADEEIGCVGARHLTQLNVVSASCAIVGEPTSLKPMAAGKGYCLAEITVYGREAHSAYPDRGASAIYRAAKLIVKIEEIAIRLQQFRADAFSPPWTTINIGEIQGGLAKNIVAPSCRFLLEWRPIASQCPELVADLVRAAVADLIDADADFRGDVKVLRMQEGFATDPGCELLRSIAKVSGHGAGAVAFGTEAPWLRRMGAEAVVFGPGSMESAHSPREFVPKEELYRCVEILKTVIHELCG